MIPRTAAQLVKGEIIEIDGRLIEVVSANYHERSNMIRIVTADGTLEHFAPDYEFQSTGLNFRQPN